MARNIQDISGSIANKLRGVSGLQVVYEYKPDKPEDGKYPYATVTPAEFSGSFADTIRNLRTYSLKVNVYQERVEASFGNEKAERLIREITDEILTAFDADTTLSGMVKYIKPARGDLSYDDGEVGERRVAEFVLDCVTVVPSQ
jgi:hypothetical protein